MSEYKRGIYEAYESSEIVCKAEWCRENNVPVRSLNHAISIFGPISKGNALHNDKYDYLLEKPRNERGQYTHESDINFKEKSEKKREETKLNNFKIELGKPVPQYVRDKICEGY